jgi:hypothetical protein
MAEPARKEEGEASAPRRLPPWIAHPERYVRAPNGQLRRREDAASQAPRTERRDERRPERERAEGASHHHNLGEELSQHGHQIAMGAGVLAAAAVAYYVVSAIAAGGASGTVGVPASGTTEIPSGTSGSLTGAPTTENDAGTAALTAALAYQSRLLRAIDALLKRRGGSGTGGIGPGGGTKTAKPRPKPTKPSNPTGKPTHHGGGGTKNRPPSRKPPTKGGEKKPGGRQRPIAPRRTGLNSGGPPVTRPRPVRTSRPPAHHRTLGPTLRARRTGLNTGGMPAGAPPPRSNAVTTALRAVTTLGRPRAVPSAPIAVRTPPPPSRPVQVAAARTKAAPRSTAPRRTAAAAPVPSAVVRASRPAARVTRT